MNRIEEWISNSCDLIIVMVFIDNERLKLATVRPTSSGILNGIQTENDPSH